LLTNPVYAAFDACVTIGVDIQRRGYGEAPPAATALLGVEPVLVIAPGGVAWFDVGLAWSLLA
jgi:hypothetical protein